MYTDEISPQASKEMLLDVCGDERLCISLVAKIADVARSYGMHDLTFVASQASERHRQVVSHQPKQEELAKEQQVKVEQVGKFALCELASLRCVPFFFLTLLTLQ